jgi:hypothetical protein
MVDGLNLLLVPQFFRASIPPLSLSLSLSLSLYPLFFPFLFFFLPSFLYDIDGTLREDFRPRISVVAAGGLVYIPL